MGAQFSGGAQAFTLDAVSAAGLTGNEAFTIEVMCAVTSVPNLSGFFGAPQIGSADARGLIATGGGSSRNIYFWGGSADLASGVDWLTDGSVQHVFVTTAGPSTTMRFYRGGVQIASGTTPALGARSSSGNWRLGDMAIGWAASPTGVIFKAAFYLRELSAADVASLTAAPWQQFGNEEIIIPIADASTYVSPRILTSREAMRRASRW